MKTNFKRIGKQSISIVLAVMMMLSTMLVGTVTSNATNEFNKQYLYVDISDYSETLIGVNTSYDNNCNDNFTGHKHTNWLQVANSEHCKNVSVGVYKFDLSKSSDDYTSFRGFQVVYSGGSKKIGVVDGSTNNCIKVNGSGELSWTTYTESTTEHTVTANFSNATVNLGENPLTSGTPITVDNNTNYTLTVTPDKGYTLTSVKFGSEEKGTSGKYTYNGSSATTITITTVKNADPKVWAIRQHFNVNSSDWADTSFTSASGTVLTAKYDFNSVCGVVEFLIHTTDDKSWYKTNSTTALSETSNSVTLNTSYRNDVKLNVTKTGTYTFKFDTSNGNLTVIYPTVTNHKVNVTASNATVAVNGNNVASGNYAEVAENATYSLSVTPSEGYYITKVTVDGAEKFAVSSVTDDNYATAKKEVTISDLTMGTADVDVKVETAEIVKPVISGIESANEINFGNSISISANDNTGSLPDGITVANKGFTVSPDSATIDGGQFSVPKALGEENSSIEYTVTYTVTLSNGETATATKTITAKDSEEQKAYKTLKADLADTTNYPDPETLNPSDYTTASINAYKTAYENAKNAITAGYPDYNAKTCIAALAALQAAKPTEKETLATPELGGTLNVGVKDTVTLSVTNESSFDDNVVFTIYKEGQTTAITTLKKDKKYTVEASILGAGSHQFYVVASLADSDYKDSKSENVTVYVYETVDVNVVAEANGTAYISSYVAVSGAQTSTSLTSATVRKGSEVTFTAKPERGYSVAAWDGVANTSNTYTVTADSNKTYTVTFDKQSVHNFVLGGKNVKYVDNKSGDNGEVKSFDTAGALALVDDEVTFETNGENNYFYLIDENGNYYAHYTGSDLDNFKVDSYNTSSNTFVLKKTGDTTAPVFRPYVENSGLYKLHVTKGDNADEYKCWIESVPFNSGWKIYGDKTHFNDWYCYKEPIIQSLGSNNKYYYSVTLSAGETAYFGFYYNNQKHQPKDNDKELLTKEGSMWADNTPVNNDPSVYKAYTITATTAGTYKICINTENSSIWYEKEADQYYLMYGDKKELLTSDDNGKTVQNDVAVTKNNGLLSVTLDSRYFDASGSMKWYAFTSNATTPNSAMVGYGKKPNVVIADDSTNYISNADVQDQGQKYALHVNLNSEYIVNSLTITYSLTTNTYTVSATATELPADARTVYATKGNKVGLQYGTTTISLLNGDNPLVDREKDYYREYAVNDKEQITVSCTVNKDAADLGYYVYAFVVNGEKVDVVDNGNNVYQTASPITVTEDLEITPIYYNKVIEADGNYVTIYTNAPEELQNSWGKSISIYSWYNGKDSNGNIIAMDGAYPGQLMMRDSQGRFAAKVSKYAYTNVDGKFTCDESKQVLGITNNNYYENQTVHQMFLLEDTQKVNRQSYDYDDFEKLTGMGYDTVEFDIKYFPEATTTNQKELLSDAYDHPSKEGTNIIDKTATNYEDLTNIDGKLVSILGYTNETAVDDTGTRVGLKTAEPLRIISVGNQYVKIDGKTDPNKWSTIWYVYDSDGKYITQGLPSDFIPRGSVGADGNFAEGQLSEQTAAYQAIVKAGLKYNSAKISYEVEMDSKTDYETDLNKKNTGYRIDGRWYYARSVDKVDVKLGIVYRNKDDNDNWTDWTLDTPTDDSAITGKETGGSASFDYTDSSGTSYTNLPSASVDRNTVITVNATNGTQYKFTGWGTRTYDADGNAIGYTPINLKDLNTTYTVSTNTELYAMYEPYATGTVTINHSKYTGSDSHNGIGIFSVTAEVFDASDNSVATQSGAGSVTLENIRNDGSYIKVTLYTQSYAKSHFLNFYYPEVASGAYTLKKEPNGVYYDTECPANARATQTFRVNVSDLFVNDKLTVKALNYYSDLKLPEVKSNITFNYNPYSTAPNPDPRAGKGTGKTTFTLTITDEAGEEVYTSKSDISSLTLKGNAELKEILANLTSHSNDYTITISMKPLADSHCYEGDTYRQTNTDGAYTYTKASEDTVWKYDQDNKSYSAKLSELFDTNNQKFYTNTINLYTDFTAKEFNYNVTFKYLGYESREYYNKNGYSQSQIPESAIINKNWWRTYTVNGTFCGTDIDKYYNSDTKTFNESFLLEVAPYEDNFVQSITWDLENVECTTSNDGSVTATVLAKYRNNSVTVTADLGDNEKKTYTVNYASLVKSKNLVSPTTQSANDEEYLFVAPPTNANGEKFSYWTIQTDNSDGIVVAKCYSREFNYIAYDNYLITACYGMDDVDESKKSVSATMQFLEYSRNKYDSGKDQYDSVKDKVYADFAVSYNYNGKMLCANINNNVVCGVVFVVNSNYSSAADATDNFKVNESELLAKVKDLNSGISSDKTMGDAKVYNYKLNKNNLDNKNRLEYSWNVNNTENNRNLTILAYSYIYNAETNECSVSDPQEFKFFNVGNKTYKG